MSTNLKIAIAEPSVIVRSGLESLLKRLPGFRIQMVEINSVESLFDSLRMHKPDVLIVNPALPGYFTLQHLKEESGCAEMKCIALLYSVSDSMLLRSYDEQINIYDSSDEIKHKLERLNAEELPDETEDDEQQSLSSREKEIVVCVVKGMTNREIADRLFLSTHTVITHRRNIARKLQIHSASGLTVYAIVNKLVELGDIKQ
ncbi:response regulator transcription factor [uncultured Parabacteroides sp.]|uniref:response regulator transcription factor n=1 Tax=uncultured Parabacteroides sp. TaxID=512312 RepID=UPI002631D074|nr:response regulator transcription factor [uncultured Parabacteroides sp.]